MISQQTIDQILGVVQIDSVVSDYVNLKKSGSGLVGLCPFHNEKTPSFHVSPSKGIYKCFGCGQAGGSVSFVMKHLGLAYWQAIKMLCEKYDVPYIEEGPEQKPDPIYQKKLSLYQLNEYATIAFFNSLKINKDAVDHLKDRGFSVETIKKYRLGFAPDQYSFFLEQATSNGYDPDLLIESGLIKSVDGRNYDRFRNRIMFPIWNANDRIVGFGGRILVQTENCPKYINSPESIIYNKSNVLYGINFARQSIKSIGECILVEGYTDVIAFHQAGITNTVSSSGTSVTQQQLIQISKLCNSINLIMDADQAGITSMIKSVQDIVSLQMHANVTILPNGQDPCSLCMQYNPDQIRQYILFEKMSFVEFYKWAFITEKSSVNERISVVKSLMDLIYCIEDQITRDMYIDQISNVFNVKTELIHKYLNGKLANDTATVSQKEDLLIDKSEAHLINLILRCGDRELDYTDGKKSLFRIILNELEHDQLTFFTHTGALFYELIRKMDDFCGVEYFTNNEHEQISETSSSLLMIPYHIPDQDQDLESILYNSIGLFKVKWIDHQIDLSLKKIQELDSESAEPIFAFIESLESAKSEIQKQMSYVV